MSRRDPLVYVLHMRDYAREAREMARRRSRGDLDSDRMFNLAMVRLLEVIGEAARRVPEEFRSRYTEVPWRRTTDFRNRLIHGYDVIDFDTVWDIVKNELSPLIEQLEEIISESPRSGC